MKERLLEFLKAENKTSAQLAEEIGVRASGISHILSGRNNPSLDFVLKMLEKYRFISTEWLLFGRGAMYKDNTMPNLFDASENNYPGGGNITGKKDGGTVSGQAADSSDDTSYNSSNDHKNSDISKAKKIIVFYNDRSFEEYNPR